MSAAMTFDARTFETRPGELIPLGAGPVATVFAGLDGWTGAAFALKVYPGRLDRRARTVLDAELSALTRLRTQASVLVADHVEQLADGRCALRMELCAPSQLHLVGNAGPLSFADGLAVGHSVATALAAAHSAGLVHGSVTPGNVLFRQSGEPVLADFGRTLRRVFPTDTTHGAEYYLAPETVLDGTRDERSDLFGLGMVLRLALSGNQLPEHVQLPGGLGGVLRTLLASNPDERTISAATVAERLGALTGPSPAQLPFDDFATVIPTRAWSPPAVPHRPAATAALPPPVPAAPGAPRAMAGGPRPAAPPARPNVRASLLPVPGVLLAAVGVLSILAVALVILLLS